MMAVWGKGLLVTEQRSKRFGFKLAGLERPQSAGKGGGRLLINGNSP
jgi:hypothetical protein